MRIRWMLPTVLLGCLAAAVISQPARAQLVNGDFETGTFTFDGNGADELLAGSTAITGWTVENGELAVITTPNRFGLAAQSGINSLDLTGYRDSPPYGGVEQTVNTLAGQNYTLSMYVGSEGGTASVDVTTGGAPTTLSNPGGGPFWEQVTDSFTATGPTLITITGSAASAGGTYIGLDDVTLTGSFSGTPEPGSVQLCAVTAFSLIGLRGFRRSRSGKR